MAINIPPNSQLDFTLEPYESPSSQTDNVFFRLEEAIFSDPPEDPEFVDPGIGELPFVGLGQKIGIVMGNPIFWILMFASLMGGMFVKFTRNAWIGLVFINMITISGWLIGLVSLGLLFMMLLLSIALGLLIKDVDRKDSMNVNVSGGGFGND